MDCPVEAPRGRTASACPPLQFIGTFFSSFDIGYSAFDIRYSNLSSLALPLLRDLRRTNFVLDFQPLRGCNSTQANSTVFTYVAAVATPQEADPRDE